MATRTSYRRGSGGHGRGRRAADSASGGVPGRRQGNMQGRHGQPSGAYVYDNLARQLEEVPERRRRPRRRRRVKVYPKQKPVSMPAISGPSFLFLLAATAVIILFGFNYLRVQSGVTRMKNKVVALQSENAKTKVDNEEMYQKIMDSVDLAEVYQIATGELGMVQAVDNQIYKYDNQKSDMVKQYGDIPDASKELSINQ